MTSSNSDFETINMINSLQVSDDILGDFRKAKFLGIDMSRIGDSRKNPYFEIKSVSLDSNVSSEDRMKAIRYLDRIPHKDSLIHATESIKKLIDDVTIPVGERYFFFANHESNFKLSDHLVRAANQHFFLNDINPLLLRLHSAHIIYQTYNHNDPVWDKSRLFVLEIALDSSQSINLRSEAADILLSMVVIDDAIVGKDVIAQLGNLYNDNKINTIYTNAQNVHDEHITSSVMGIIRSLIEEKKQYDRNLKIINVINIENKRNELTQSDHTTKPNETIQQFPSNYIFQNNNQLWETIQSITESYPSKTTIRQAIITIFSHPAKYEGISLSEILNLVWNKIQSQTPGLKCELESRLLQELEETDLTCGTGICSRIINSLSGYIKEEQFQIKMSFSSQLRSNIFARFQNNLKFISTKDQDMILSEISDSNSSKEYTKEFIDTYDIRSELLKEFIPHITEEYFNTTYEQTIKELIN